MPSQTRADAGDYVGCLWVIAKQSTTENRYYKQYNSISSRCGEDVPARDVGGRGILRANLSRGQPALNHNPCLRLLPRPVGLLFSLRDTWSLTSLY